MTTAVEDLGHRLYAFLGGRSTESAEDLLADDFTGHLTDGLPRHLGGDYHSRDDMVTRGWGRVGLTFHMRPEVDHLYAVGDDMLVGRGHYVGTAIPTGRSVRAAFAHFWTVADGRFTSVYQVTDSAAWAAALD